MHSMHEMGHSNSRGVLDVDPARPAASRLVAPMSRTKVARRGLVLEVPSKY